MPSDSTQAFKKDDDAESKSSDSSFISGIFSRKMIDFLIFNDRFRKWK